MNKRCFSASVGEDSHSLLVPWTVPTPIMSHSSRRALVVGYHPQLNELETKAAQRIPGSEGGVRSWWPPRAEKGTTTAQWGLPTSSAPATARIGSNEKRQNKQLNKQTKYFFSASFDDRSIPTGYMHSWQAQARCHRLNW